MNSHSRRRQIAAASGRKAFTVVRQPAGDLGSLLVTGRQRFDYAREVGRGDTNSIVQACVQWICRTFPEAPVMIYRREADGTETKLPEHPLLGLLTDPNDYYSGELLWKATLADLTTSGNAYWLKVRNAQGGVVQLWWAPSALIEPRWPADGSAYISHYEYRPSGTALELAVSDVVHFRDGLDPHNTRKGLSPLAGLLREIFTDEEAAAWSASLLRNMGIPGVLITPDVDDPGAISAEDAREIKADFRTKFGGDNRGEPMVLPSKARVTVLSFNPQQMDFKTLRRLPEERISAVLGIPAIVAGLGAGLDRSTFANMSEAREMAYESNIVPTQRLLAGQLRTQLLRDFGDIAALRVGFDTSEVRVLQEDENKRWQRVTLAFSRGLLTVARAKELIGETPEESDNVYLRPLGVTAVAPGEAPEPEPEEDTTLGSDSTEEPSEETPTEEPEKRRKGRRLPERKERRTAEGLEDPDGPAKDEGEARLTRLLKSRLNGQYQAVMEALGDPPDLSRLDEAFWATEAGLMLADLRPAIEAMARGAGEALMEREGLGVSWELVAERAAEWASVHAGEEIRLIDEATRRAVARQVTSFLETPGMTLGQLRESLSPWFDPKRAGRIAVTETTRAFAEGARLTARVAEEAGIHLVATWHTAEDELVCETCGELDGKQEGDGVTLQPPAHPNCRCWITHTRQRAR